MKLVVLAVGRAKEREVRTLLDDYVGRIRRYADVDELELRDEPDDAKLTHAIDKALSTVGPRAELVVLDVGGRQFSSEAFAKRVGDTMDRASVPVFAIGGAEGLPRAVRDRAAWTVSLGPMTLPHRLARVVLCEQIYRAFTILRGEPYAREGAR